MLLISLAFLCFRALNIYGISWICLAYVLHLHMAIDAAPGLTFEVTQTTFDQTIPKKRVKIKLLFLGKERNFFLYNFPTDFVLIKLCLKDLF